MKLSKIVFLVRDTTVICLLVSKMKGSSVLQLVVVALSVYHTLSADGCGSGEYSVRCGEECTGDEGYCTCGEEAEKFDYRDNTTWCCNASECEQTGKKGYEN